ncbi:alpha/beta hydrolase fold protein [Tanacetum coccineum]
MKNAFAYYRLGELLREKLKKNKNARFMVTGHSLGGALAVLFPAILAFHNEFELLERLEGVYTYGQPRVGDSDFCRFMEDLLGANRYFRFVYANDIVPRIPSDNSDFQFKHFGYCYYFNSFYNGQVVKEVENKNYFSKKLALVHLNALFELARALDLCRESPDFSSIIGLTDTRLDLDDEISNEDPRYYSALAIMASKTAYENEERGKKIVSENWKMEHLGFYNCTNAFDTKKTQSTQAFVFCDKTGDHELICVSFRGTSPFCADDWCTDFNISWFRLEGIGKVHMGFLKALGLQKCKDRYAKWPKEIKEDKQNKNAFAYYKIRELLREKLKKNKNARFMVTGHSLGGALAVLFPAILAFHNEFELLERLEGVYTYGQPRVGDSDFCRFMEDLLGANRYFRFVYANDIVPRIPSDNSDFQFKHFGYCYYFNSFYKGQVVKEVENKNYFSKKLALVHLNALFELVRSFVLPYTYGRKYKEGILLWVVSIVWANISTGASAHCPQY